MGRATIVCLTTVLVLLGGCREKEPEEVRTEARPAGKSANGQPSTEAVTFSSDRLSALLAQFNRGAALMEQYRYAEAAKTFEEVVKQAPHWVAARFNLGLAYFNMHGQRGAQQNLDAARKIFQEIVESDPGHLPAHFCLGLYFQHFGENEEALKHFGAVFQHDSKDPYVGYEYAETLLSLERQDEGTKVLEQVVSLDPGFISAVYRLALQYRRTGQPEKAKPLFVRFRELNSAELTGGSFIVQQAYGTVGKYYQAVGADDLPLPLPDTAAARRVVFSPEIRSLSTVTCPWSWAKGTVGLPGIAVADVDGDGDLDLCLTGLDEKGTTRLWLNDGSGQWAAGPVLATHGVSPCFGDVDNDGDVDLWLGRAGDDLLLTNDGSGKFLPDSPESVRGGDLLTHSARLVDLDSDGDLDLLACRNAAGSIPAGLTTAPADCGLYNNNRDGTYQDVASELGLALADMPVSAVVYDDFDNDRDLDMVIFSSAAAGEPVAWVNDRAGKFRILPASATGLATHPTISATCGDPDKDGDRDLLVSADSGMHLYRNDGRFVFQPDREFANGLGRLGGSSAQFADMDNDGDLDIVVADAHRRDGSRGPALLLNDWPRKRFLDALSIDPGNLLGAINTGGNASCVAADFTGNGRCDILLLPIGKKPLLVENVTPGGNWIELDLLGTRPVDNKARSNSSAIGARVEIKTGALFQQYVVGVSSGPVAMAPLRIHAGLGQNSQVDWLRIIWPDAVLQAELEIAGNRAFAVAELPRKTSSCPLLFAWDGNRFEFVADFGGVGGLGYLVAPGQYATPDPTEYLRIPHLSPLDGRYVLQSLTPLEEVTYFDEAKLVAVDHPQGTEVYPHEMMAVGLAPPPFEVFCFREMIDPVSAVDHRGVDVTGRLCRVDRRYAGATAMDPRFTGLAEDHFVELDFGERLERVAPHTRLVLVLVGWVEYGYSSTNFAAAQAQAHATAPSVHVLRDGRWVELFHEAGYPAGLQHVMTLDLGGKILPGDRRIRISTNMELYWDRIFIAEHLADAEIRVQEAPPDSADLHFFGYPREYSPDGRHPNLYDYNNADRTAGWKIMSGRYTRYGEVGELLQEADDCYVIMGHGDELTLRFPADAFGPVPKGMRRTFLLKTDSFCKDMDLYTAYPDSVEPLPFHAMSGYPYGPHETYPDDPKTKRYRAKFNTREVSVPRK